jgi:hypothetical protein
MSPMSDLSSDVNNDALTPGPHHPNFHPSRRWRSFEMLRSFAFIAILALAGTIEMGVAPAKAQGASSDIDWCIAACKQQGGRRCDNYCERGRSSR